jgi:hypothetical protein
MATTGPERAHLWLAKAVGSWKVEGLYYFAAGSEPVEAIGTEEVEMFGPYFRRGHLEIDLLGSTVRGCTLTGFDPLRQVFVSTWFDTTNPHLYSYQGRFDEEANVLVLTGANTDPGTGKRAAYRSIERYALPDERALELFVEVPGRPETQILTYRYERVRS